MLTQNNQNPKFTCSIGRPYVTAMKDLKARWSFKDRRLFSKNICEATIIYGNLEGSEKGKMILLLLNKLCDNIRYDLLSGEVVDQYINLVISSYLELSGVVVNGYEQPSLNAVYTSDPSPIKESKMVKNVNQNENLFFIDNDIFNNLDSD